MEKLPKDLLFELAINMSPPVLVNLCSTNSKYSVICKSPAFWRRKLDKDYPLEMKGIAHVKNPKFVYMKRFESISKKIETFISVMIDIVFGVFLSKYLKSDYRADLYKDLYNLYEHISKNWDEIIEGNPNKHEDILQDMFYDTVSEFFPPDQTREISERVNPHIVDLMKIFLGKTIPIF